VELTAGGIQRALLLLRGVMNKRTTVFVDDIAEKEVRSHLSARRVVMQVTDDFSAEQPQIVHVPANGLRGKTR
jgi:hypothetical protein